MKISITRETDYLCVCNTKNPLKKAPQYWEGIGLANIKKRYQRFTDQQVIIDDNDQRFCVKLPLLQLNDQS
jgi:hypothetical protein